MPTGYLWEKSQRPAAAAFQAKSTTTQGRSLQSFLASLSVAGAIFLAEVLCFLALRIKFPSIYASRTHAIPNGDDINNRSRILTLNFKSSDAEIVETCGLDAYLFLRYLQVLLWIFVPIAIAVLPILIPVNLLGGRGRLQGVSGLDKLSWTNVNANQTVKYWVHLNLAIMIILWTCRVIYREVEYFAKLRRQHVVDSLDGGLLSRTVLVTDIPLELLDVAKLKKLYNICPGGIQDVTINRDYKQLVINVKKRMELSRTLEAAETRLIQKANRAFKRLDQDEMDSSSKDAQGTEALVTQSSPNGPTVASVRKSLGQPGKPLWTMYLQPRDREYLRLPIHSWLPSMPFLGERIDKIDFCRQALSKISQEIQAEQSDIDSHVMVSSAFVIFNEPIGAHMAAQSVQHFAPHQMTVQYLEDLPDQIVWTHISMSWWERCVRNLISKCLLAILVFGSIVPVAFTGLLSQADYLASIVPWLSRIIDWPNWFLAFLQGVLPPALLASVMAVVPLLLRFLISKQGVHTRSAVELSMQTYYFLFLFIQVFFVVSVSASAAAFFSGLVQDFKSVAALLAQNLPKASNYFFSYMLLQALSVSATTLLQTARLLRLGFGYIHDNTAREKWDRRKDVEIGWGSFIPVYTNLAVIGLIYSVVSPIILIFNIFTFALLLVIQRYNILNVSKGNLDTGGLIYPKALNQLFVGLYVMEAYLIGLFCLVRDTQGRSACAGQAVIMVFAMLLTAMYQVMLNDAFQPLVRHLPLISEYVNQNTATANKSYRIPGFLTCYLKSIEAALKSLTLFEDTDGDGITSEKTTFTDDTCEYNMREARSFQHEALLAKSPIIWLPRDELGMTKDEIHQTHMISEDVIVSDLDARLGKNAQVIIDGKPPDKNPETADA